MNYALITSDYVSSLAGIYPTGAEAEFIRSKLTDPKRCRIKETDSTPTTTTVADFLHKKKLFYLYEKKYDQRKARGKA